MPLDETFRRILRANFARQNLADEITGYDWFHKRQQIGFKFDLREYQAAKSSLERLKQDIKGQQIRLRGRLNGRVEDIDPIDAAKGEIDVFENALEIGKQIYTDVYCVTLQTISRPRQKFDRARKVAQAIWGSDGPQRLFRPRSRSLLAASAYSACSHGAGSRRLRLSQPPDGFT
jgi:hypothetical protein